MKWTSTIIFSFFILALNSQELKRFDFKAQKMGTQFRIIFYAENDEIADEAKKKAFSKIDELNSLFSDYDPQSEVSKLHEHAKVNSLIKVSEDLYKLLSKAQDLSVKSDGAFDVTIGPLSKLWRRAIRRQEFPNAKLLAQKRGLVGFRYIKLLDDQQIVFLKSGMRLDFGGIAKGYAVDEVYKVLMNSGVRYALVDGGGDIYAGAHPEHKNGWPVIQGVETIYIKNQALASSGGTYKYLLHNGKTYCHIIDPRTGVGIAKIEPVFIRARSCMLADAFASIAAIEGQNKANRILSMFD